MPNTHFMKTKFLLLLMVIPFFGYAQGNLQFNQVLTFSGTSGSPVVYTVPEGKVAKITKATRLENSFQGIWNKITYIYSGVQLDQTAELEGTWMRANDYIGVSNFTVNLTNDYGFPGYMLSIIEYNIIIE